MGSGCGGFLKIVMTFIFLTLSCTVTLFERLIYDIFYFLRHIKARKEALLVEKERSAKIASLPPPPPGLFEVNYSVRELGYSNSSLLLEFSARPNTICLNLVFNCTCTTCLEYLIIDSILPKNALVCISDLRTLMHNTNIMLFPV